MAQSDVAHRSALSVLAPCPHVAFQHAVDPRLVVLARCFEMGQYGSLDAQGNLFGEIRFDEFRLLPEGIVQFGNIAEVDTLVLGVRNLGGSQGFIVSVLENQTPTAPLNRGPQVLQSTFHLFLCVTFQVIGPAFFLVPRGAMTALRDDGVVLGDIRLCYHYLPSCVACQAIFGVLDCPLFSLCYRHLFIPMGCPLPRRIGFWSLSQKRGRLPK